MFKNMRDRQVQEEKMEKEGRLPPGQSLTQKFPVLHYGPVPKFNPSTWDLRVWGEVEEEVRWNWAEFNELPRKKLTMDIVKCRRSGREDKRFAAIRHEFDQSRVADFV